MRKRNMESFSNETLNKRYENTIYRFKFIYRYHKICC